MLSDFLQFELKDLKRRQDEDELRRQEEIAKQIPSDRWIKFKIIFKNEFYFCLNTKQNR